CSATHSCVITLPPQVLKKAYILWGICLQVYIFHTVFCSLVEQACSVGIVY
uniref:Uncharacterized protein n=1 Tax=Ciona intestinalis TaxID=7719 RepID=H2Y1U2_CIOIN